MLVKWFRWNGSNHLMGCYVACCLAHAKVLFAGVNKPAKKPILWTVIFKMFKLTLFPFKGNLERSFAKCQKCKRIPRFGWLSSESIRNTNGQKKKLWLPVQLLQLIHSLIFAELLEPHFGGQTQKLHRETPSIQTTYTIVWLSEVWHVWLPS